MNSFSNLVLTEKGSDQGMTSKSAGGFYFLNVAKAVSSAESEGRVADRRFGKV